jgi:cell division protease FtsH
VNSTVKSLVFWVALVVVGFAIYNLSNKINKAEKTIAFSDFMGMVKEQKVPQVTITGQEITGTTTDGKGFQTIAPLQYEGLGNELMSLDVQVESKEATASPWASLFLTWAPMLLILGFWFVFIRQMQSGGNKALSFGKSKAKLSSSSQKKVTFKDVAGVDEAKEELQEIIEFLKEPQKFQKLGGRIPKGVLLMGPPEPARRCSLGRSPARRTFRSSRSADPTSSKCS